MTIRLGRMGSGSPRRKTYGAPKQLIKGKCSKNTQKEKARMFQAVQGKAHSLKAREKGKKTARWVDYT